MTSRERWTVYPLLFLAIGLALRAVSIPPSELEVHVIDADRVVCGEIVVKSADGPTLIHVGRVKGDGGGRIEISDHQGREAMAIGTGPDGRDGIIEFFDTEGNSTGLLDARVLSPAAP
ncbi:MAG: hypothetical protein ACKO4Z_11260 [Planctomycetota bacterium]|nr:hypothetical protein [Planctomycetota bacterium]